MASTIQPEMRLDINGDGLPYTEAEFKEHYNGPKEWINSPMAKFDEAKGIWVAVVKTISDDSNMDGAASGTTHIDQLAQKDESSGTTIRNDDAKRLEAIKAAKEFLATKGAKFPHPGEVALPKNRSKLTSTQKVSTTLTPEELALQAAAVRAATEFHASRETKDVAIAPKPPVDGKEAAQVTKEAQSTSKMDSTKSVAYVETINAAEEFHVARAVEQYTPNDPLVESTTDKPRFDRMPMEVASSTSPLQLDISSSSNVETLTIAGNTSNDIVARIKSMTIEDIEKVFKKFDVDNSGDLSCFELMNAIQALTQHTPSTRQVMEILHSADNGHAHEHNNLTLAEFIRVVKNFDWEAEEFNESLKSIFGGDIYVCDFYKPTLGFGVLLEEKSRLLVVEVIVDAEVRQIVHEKDILRAINGAPLGYGTNLSILAKKLHSITKPLRVSFERYIGTYEVMDSPELSLSNEVIEVHDKSSIHKTLIDTVGDEERESSEEETLLKIEQLERDFFGLIRNQHVEPSKRASDVRNKMEAIDDKDLPSSSATSACPVQIQSRGTKTKAKSPRNLDAETDKKARAAAMVPEEEREMQTFIKKVKTDKLEAALAQRTKELALKQAARKKAAIDENYIDHNSAASKSILENIRAAALAEEVNAAAQKEAAKKKLDDDAFAAHLAAETLKAEVIMRRNKLLKSVEKQKKPPRKASIELYLDDLIARKLKTGYFVGASKSSLVGTQSRLPGKIANIYKLSAERHGLLTHSPSIEVDIPLPMRPLSSSPHETLAAKELEIKLIEARKQAALMEKTAHELKEDVKERETKIIELQKQIQDIDIDLQEADGEKNEPDARLVTRLKAQLASARESEDLLSAEIDTLRKKTADMDGELINAKAQLNSKYIELEENNTKFNELQAKYTMVDGRAAELERSLETQSDRRDELAEARADDKVEVESIISDLREELAKEKAGRIAAETEAEQKQLVGGTDKTSTRERDSTIESLRNELAQEKSFRTSAERELERARSAIKAEGQSSMIHMETKIKTLREELAQEKAGRIAAIEEIELIKSKEARATSSEKDLEINSLRNQLDVEKAARATAEKHAKLVDLDDGSNEKNVVDVRSSLEALRRQLDIEKIARMQAEEELDKADEAMDLLKRSRDQFLQEKMEDAEVKFAARLQRIELDHKNSLEAHAFSDHLFSSSSSPTPGDFSPGKHDDPPARRESNLIQNLQIKLRENSKQFQQQLDDLDDDHHHLTKSIAAKIMARVLRFALQRRSQTWISHWRQVTSMHRVADHVRTRLENARLREEVILNQLSEATRLSGHRNHVTNAERAAYEAEMSLISPQRHRKVRHDVMHQMMTQQQQRGPHMSAYERGVLEKPKKSSPVRRRGGNRGKPLKKRGGGFLPNIKSPNNQTDEPDTEDMSPGPEKASAKKRVDGRGRTRLESHER